MTKNKEIEAEYFESSKSVVFNIKPVADDIDKLMREYDKLEKNENGKK